MGSGKCCLEHFTLSKIPDTYSLWHDFVGTNIFLNIVLSRYLGIGGLALATSIAAIVATLLLFVKLRIKIGGFGLKELSLSLGKITAASLLMGFLALYVYRYLGNIVDVSLSLIAAICIGGLIYFALVFIYEYQK